MKKIFQIIIVFVVLIICASYQQVDKIKSYLVISLKIKNHLLYSKCILEKNLFDSTTCLTLSYDTIASNQQTDNFGSKLFFDLDNLKPPVSFSIKGFCLNASYQGGDIWKFHNNACFTQNDIKLINGCDETRRLWIEDVTINNGSDTTDIRFPPISFHVKD
jgi:hypothetical protein